MVNKNNQPKDEADDLEVTTETGADTGEEMETIEAEATAAEKIKQLQGKLKTAEAEKHEANEQLQRMKADYLNARKLMEEERDSARKRQERKFIETLLPLCDSFSVAMQDTAVWEQVDEQWRKGVEGIYAQLQSILTAHNVVRDDPTGQPFDPARHEAVLEEPVTDPTKHDTVVRVVQAGYHFNDEQQTLIRPARVGVGVNQDATPDNSAESDEN